MATFAVFEVALLVAWSAEGTSPLGNYLFLLAAPAFVMYFFWWPMALYFLGLLITSVMALQAWSANVVGRPASVRYAPGERRQLAWGFSGGAAGLLVGLAGFTFSATRFLG